MLIFFRDQSIWENFCWPRCLLKRLFWGKILASALKRPLAYRRNREVGSALGAARLAWLATNQCDPQSAFTSQPLETLIEPDLSLQDQYTEKFATFRELYRRLSDMFITL